MKKIILYGIMIAIFAGCGGSSSGDKKEETKEEEKKEGSGNDISNNPDYQKGLALIAKNDCLTCHKVDEKVNGPSYRDVANKYAGMPDTIISHLAGKVIKGGNGVWGEVFMTPHPGVSKEDAEAMVKYVLLLKK